MPKTEVPITPAVLEWAILESGLSVTEVAKEAGVELADLNGWLTNTAKPGVTEVRSLAQVLLRPVAAFLLPTPPASHLPDVRFRHTPGVSGRSLTPKERRYLRKAVRLQRMLEWVVQELREPRPSVPSASLGDDADSAAQALRAILGVTIETQLQWPSASVAFDGWRDAVEALGVTVFLFQLGADNCRGFSLWNKAVPVIAVNTAWNDEARVFTLFHELGHLLVRTDSACATADPAGMSGTWDPAERWCEHFASSVLLPEAMLRRAIAERLSPGTTRIHDVGLVRRLATHFHTSLRATTIRLIELGFASWDLYRELPASGDAKSRGGRANGGRDRQEIQEDSLGGHATRLFHRAVKADVVTRSQALTYLDVPDSALDQPATRGV
ncbi:MAG TPA: ImmA/IrrE family metallo-endopeptidase [Dehalococcoidia bacterium]|nr:ImmA/IrrE family metallo-endopeptidase [Dehalococcoidia bacterium]